MTWALRRLVIAPLVVLLAVLIWVTLPLWLIGLAAISPIVSGRLRPLRIMWVATVYLTCEALLLLVMFGLWVASGFGWRLRTPYFEGIHYDLVQGAMWIFFREARRVLRLSIETEGPTPAAHPGRPILVCCRHAGVGDSFVLIHTLMAWYDREPRVVLKDTLAWDPMIDVVLRRIPARFISPNPAAGEDLEAQIAELATGLDGERRVRDLPGGRQLHPEAPAEGDRPAPAAGHGADGAARRADDPRAGPETWRLPGRARRGPGRRRRARRPHRARPPGLGRRHLARAADGQADHHALVAGAAQRDPRRAATNGSTGSSGGGSGSTSGSRRTGRRIVAAGRF